MLALLSLYTRLQLQQDMRGKPIQVKAQGYFAWALQHEIDHLNGILYLDHLNRPEDLRRIREDDDIINEYRAEIDDLIEVNVGFAE